MTTPSPADADWDQALAGLVAVPPLLQSRAWGDVQAHAGWEVERVRLGSGAASVQLQGSRGGRWGYVPRGPVPASAESVGELLAWARGQGLVRLRLEPEAPPEFGDVLRSLDFRPRPDASPQQPAHTSIVDLRPEDELLASFKPKTRYNIRLAARRGVNVRLVAAAPANLDVMYRLMAATQARAGFPLRPRAYFEDYWAAQNAAGQGQIFFALLGDEVLAGAFITHFGKRAWYKDGGSSGRHRELMAPHLLQWEAMRWLRGQGTESYDLVAVPPRAELSEAHPLYGLYRFKSGFSEEITEYAGTLDLPLGARRYSWWTKVGERAAHQLSWRVRHNLIY